MEAKDIYRTIRYLALAGNILFILWVSANGIDEGFSGTIYQKLSYVVLVLLLLTNFILIYRTKK